MKYYSEQDKQYGKKTESIQQVFFSIHFTFFKLCIKIRLILNRLINDRMHMVKADNFEQLFW